MKKLLIIILVIGAGAVAAWYFWPVKKELAKPKNVILITIDTLRADRLGCYGYTQAQTPIIDSWAQKGALFQHATATTPLTLPSHSSIMTGMYPVSHGVRDNAGFYLEDNWDTLAETLKGSGFATGGFVSAFVLDRKWGIAQGFDEYFDHFELSKYKTVSLDAVQRRGDETMDAALKWMNNVKDRPFFSWIHLYDPHTPYDPPDPFREPWAKQPFGMYDGEIAYTDFLMGKLHAFLEQNDLYSTTTVVLTADHGESLGEHNESGHGFFIYDATTHVPLIILTPGGNPIQVREQVRTVDLFPTICSLLHVPLKSKLDGVNLIPLLRGEKLPAPLSAYSESYYPRFHYGWNELKSLRTVEYKYIEAPKPELYRVSQDTDESDNLFNAETRRADPFKNQITQLVKAGGAELKGPKPMDDEALEKLQALGYIGTYTAPVVGEGGTLADPKDKIGLYNLLKLAQWKSADEKTDEALADITQVLRMDSGILEAHLVQGNIFMKKDEFAKARGSFQAAIQLNASFTPAIFSMAVAFEREEQWDAARAGFERVLELDPRDTKAYFHLGEIAAAQGQQQAALKHFQKAIEMDPESAAFRNRTGACLLELERFDEAIVEINKALEMNDRFPNAHFNRALVHESRNQWALAMQDYRMEVELFPESYPARFNLSRIFRKVGDVQSERRELEECIKTKPDYGVAYIYLAKNLMDTGGDLKKAEVLAAEGIEKVKETENKILGNYLLADLLNRLGRPREAEQHLQRAEQLRRS
jgi:arylsulfatase A-like enzyme/tetratricopeptide (TPR) repeat protein